jgi:hypothetical protein
MEQVIPLETLTVAHAFHESRFVESESLLSGSQEPTNGSYPEAHESPQHPPKL